MFSIIKKISQVLCLLAFIPAAQANKVTVENYDIYIGDLNSDGAADYYFHQKPLVLILHGDIATPILVPQTGHFAVYRSADSYSDPQLISLSEAEIAQKLASAALRPALNPADFTAWSSGVSDENFVLLRGADSAAPALLLQTIAGNVLPNKVHVYSTINYPNISNRAVPLRIVDINNDGRMDIVLGSYTSDVGETAYLADATQIPKEFFEVTPATTKPSVGLNSTDGISYHVGTVAGEFRVDESGSATYNIPINLPAGVAGVTPQVSLGYSSGAGTGVLGKGGSLNAFSTISRCRKTLVHDTKTEAITWTSEDRFCLDGQRLILISGTYGSANSTYKTEMDSFVTVTVVGDVLAGSGYFKSVSKDGSTSFFGRTSNSKFFNAAGGVSKTLTWAQSRFQDNIGNGIDYIYEGSSTDGQRLKTIQYAYSAPSLNTAVIPQSGTSSASVHFEYETRPDPSFSLVAGYRFDQTQRLRRVIVKNQNSEVRRYVIDYMSATTSDSRYQNKVSRMERIRECSGQFNCLVPTTFMWGGGSHLNMASLINNVNLNDANANKYLLNYFFADVTGNGKQDLVYLMFESGSATSASVSVRIKYADEDESVARSSVFYLYNKNIANIRLASIDYNADGRQDLALYDGSNWKIYLATPRSNNKWTIDASSTLIDVGITTADTSFIDINGDGLADAVTKDFYRLLVRNAESNTSNKAYSFGSSVNFLWDERSTFPGMDGPIAVNIGCGQSSYSKRISPGRAADFNGDGVVDFIGEYSQTATCHPPSAPAPQVLTKTLSYALVVINGQIKNYGNISLSGTDITPVDINGDGLSDLVYLSAGSYYYRINNGTGFDDAVLWATLPTYTSGPKATPQYLDFNGDGFVDIVWHNRNDGKIYARLFGDTQDIVIKSNAGTAQNDAHMIMDVTGDGLYDHLRVTSTSLNTYKGVLSVTGAPIPCHYYSTPVGMQCVGGNPNPSVPVPDNEQHTNVYSIDTGLGAVTRINYGTLSNSGRYTTTDVNLSVTTEVRPTGCPQDRGYPCSPTYTTVVTDSSDFYSRLNGGWQLPAGSSTLVANNANKGAPVLEVNGAIQVVTAVESSAPVAGALPGNVNQNAMSKVDYYYGEAKMQASGRGFLGFGTLKTIDAQTNITTLSTYRQDFPFTGKPLSTVVFKDSGASTSLLSSASNKWAYKEFTGADNTKYYQPYISDAEEKTFDYTNAALLQTIASNNQYDDFGNLIESTVVTSGLKANGTTATTLTSKTVNNYGTSNEYKRFGRLTSSTVTTTRDGTSASRSSTFTYYGASDSNGAEYLLKSEAVNVTGLASTTTTYEYDVFGNKTKTTTQANDTLKTKSVVNNFGTTGRYLVSTTNDLQQSSQINARDIFGNVKKATDINQIQSETFYDAMGSEYLRKDDTGAWARTDVAFCNTTTCSSLVGAKYRVYKRVAGGGKAYEYFDALGRVIRSSKLGLDGWVHIDTEYDNLSRIKRQSVPFSGAAAEYWTENSYDPMGRLVSVVAPDGSKTDFAYDGNTTTTTNALLQKRKETRNGLGQLEKVEDHLGGVVEYQYDLFGNLTQAQTTADGSSVAVKICYDALGRKVAMHDPDKGGFKGNGGLTCGQVVGVSPRKAGWWYYSYNAFGELVEQVDPKGQKVKNYYDQLGRMTGRIDYLASGAIEGLSQWFYEGGVGSHNPGIKGALTAVVMNTATNITTAQAESFINNGAASCNESATSCHKTLYHFDIYSRPSETTVYFPGSNKPYVSSVQYDNFGRPYRQYDALDNLIRDSNGRETPSGTQTHYNTNGYAFKTTDIATGRALSTTLKTNVLGQVIEELRGNGLRSISTYDIKTGLLTNQKTLNALNLTNVQNNVYGWDTVGNLRYRQNLSGKTATPAAGNSSMSSYSQSESFCYDGLNRLIKTNAGTTSTSACASLALSAQDLRYDGHGNIKYKKDVGDYSYDSGTTAGPHAVTLAGGKSYAYDANGNNISGDGRALEYTSYDMVSKITKGSNSTEFKYGPDRTRWQRNDFRGSTIITTYIGNVERIQVATNVVEWKRNVAGVVYSYRTDNNNQLLASDARYIYTDHLGSVDLITDAAGEVGGQYSKISHAMSFDAWGTRRNFTQWNDANFAFVLSSITVPGFEPITRRGYTGHEMVDDMGIIHMNGRIYDSKLGRFLQADPFIQAASNTQSFNRYSYLLNNPLNATDPSGYFLKKLWNKIRPFVGVIVGAVVAIACYGTCTAQAWALGGAIAGAAGAAATGGNIIQGAVLGAFSGVAGSIGGWQGFLASGMVGGVSSVMMGGKFGHGFISAGISGAVGSTNNWYADLLIKSTLGGVISEMTGGKFANGARSSAIAFVIQSGIQKVGAREAPADLSVDGQQGPERFDTATQEKINKEITLAADAAKANEKGFDTSGDAAIYLRGKVQNIAEKYDIEIGAYLPKVNGRYIIGDVQTSFHNHTVASMDDVRVGVDWFHTHQSKTSNGSYSEGDILKSRLAGATGYLSDKTGLYRFRAYDYGAAKVQANGRSYVNPRDYFDTYSYADKIWR